MNRPVRTRMPGGVGGGAGDGSAYPISKVRSLTLAVRKQRRFSRKGRLILH